MSDGADYTNTRPECQISEEDCPEGYYDSWEYEDWETGEMVTQGYCDYRCLLAGGVYVEECDSWSNDDGTEETHCYNTCSFGEDNELCAYPYTSEWGEERCDVYCAPNSGILGQDG